MTKLEIVEEVADRLNYTSATALERVSRAVDRLYKVVTSTIGLNVTRNVDVVVLTIINQRTLVVSSIEKVTAIRYDDGTQLHELHYEELRSRHSGGSGRPTAYATRLMGATTVEIIFDRLPDAELSLNVSGYTTLATLDDQEDPAFPESFHDILIEGILKDEYRKLEKPQLATLSKALYEERLRELRVWIAKSAYEQTFQGKTAADRRFRDGMGGTGGSSPFILPAWHVGSGAPAGTLGRVGDFYLDSDSGDIYEKTAQTTWTLVANIEGPVGPAGPQGDPGPQGPQGDPGEVGLEGTPTPGNLASWFSTTDIEDSGIATATVALLADLSPRRVWGAQANNPPPTNAALFGTRNAHPILAFSDSALLSAIFPGVMWDGYSGGDLEVELIWAAVATTGDVVWASSVEAMPLGSLDIDADSFPSSVSQTAAVPGTSGLLASTLITLTGAALNGIVAGDAFRLRIRRDGPNGSDTAVGDGQLLRVALRDGDT